MDWDIILLEIEFIVSVELFSNGLIKVFRVFFKMLEVRVFMSCFGFVKFVVMMMRSII